MPRLPHGRVNISMDTLRDARDAVADRAEETNLGFAVVKSPDARRFDYLFPGLQNPDDLLPETPDTVENLIRLGQAMKDTGGQDSGDANISAAYTYFGQFVDHDITLGITSVDAQNLLSPDLAPLSLDAIRDTTKNIRTATFELDSVYNHPAPRDPKNRSKMRIGKVTTLDDNQNKPNRRPDNKADENDLPRRRRRFDAKNDRAALIGDARNDENTIIAQLHLAFLLAHNKLVDRGESFEGARELLRQHYQHIVIHDFLKKVADPQVVDDILANGPRFYNPGKGNDFFMPMEFSAAAYRFGHSMVRAEYDFNLNFNTSGEDGTIPATLAFLFTFSALTNYLERDRRC